MQTQTLLLAAVTALAAGTLSGCGVARQLTTQTRTVVYTASLPPMPANTMGHTQFSISDEVRTTYSKYHGGVDWSRLAYQVQNGSAVQPATLKLYSSLDGSLTANQLDQQATLFETLTVPPSATQTLTLTQAPKNEPLRSFLARALSQHDVTTLYVYGVTSSADPTAMVSVQSFTVQVQVHGSYF